MKDNYSALLLAGVVLVSVSQAIEGMTSPLAVFLRGVLIGLSIVCSTLGLLLYARTPKKG